MDMQLKGKVALVTGGARDVGLDLRGRLELFRSACDATRQHACATAVEHTER